MEMFDGTVCLTVPRYFNLKQKPKIEVHLNELWIISDLEILINVAGINFFLLKKNAQKRHVHSILGNRKVYHFWNNNMRDAKNKKRKREREKKSSDLKL